MIKAVIFDFDYTLGDSTNGIVLCVNYALEQLGFGIKGSEEIRKTVGLSLKDTYRALTMRHNAEEAAQFSAYFKEKADFVMVENTVLYHGVEDLLQTLRQEGYQIGIVTTKFRYRIVQILEKFQAIDSVDLIVGAENVNVEKPNPEGLLWAIDRLGLTKQEVLYVGDSLVDAKTADNAQANFAGVLTGTTTAEDFEQYPSVFIGDTVNDLCSFLNCEVIKAT
ncbi:MAG: HAD-IA family hydrolase [Lachnospiraceae bacterium]|nr:HAD-IA family hydrolase [Lachnospiraceae bacterium]